MAAGPPVGNNYIIGRVCVWPRALLGPLVQTRVSGRGTRRSGYNNVTNAEEYSKIHTWKWSPLITPVRSRDYIGSLTSATRDYSRESNRGLIYADGRKKLDTSIFSGKMRRRESQREPKRESENFSGSRWIERSEGSKHISLARERMNNNPLSSVYSFGDRERRSYEPLAFPRCNSVYKSAFRDLGRPRLLAKPFLAPLPLYLSPPPLFSHFNPSLFLLVGGSLCMWSGRSVVRGDLLWELWGARALAVPRETPGCSARGGASKRRYCLVNLRFTSGWPPSKHHHYADIVPRVSRTRPPRYLSPRRESIAASREKERERYRDGEKSKKNT